MMVRQPDVNGEYTSTAVTFEKGMLVTLRDNAVVRVLSSYGSGSAIVVEGAVLGKPADGEWPITLPTALPSNSAELRAGLPAPIPIRLVLPFYPGMTVYDALYAVGGPTPFARTADSYVVRAGERIELDAAALWDGDGLHGDLPLQPRDQVVVPAAELFVTVLGLGQPPRRHPLPARSHRQRLPAAGRRAHPRGRPGTGPLRGQDRPQPARRGAGRPGDQRRHPDRRTPGDPAPAGRHPARRPHHQPVQQHRHRHQHRQRLDRSLAVADTHVLKLDCARVISLDTRKPPCPQPSQTAVPTLTLCVPLDYVPPRSRFRIPHDRVLSMSAVVSQRWSRQPTVRIVTLRTSWTRPLETSNGPMNEPWRSCSRGHLQRLRQTPARACHGSAHE